VIAARIGIVAALVVAGAAQAQSPETLGWLRKIHEASTKLSYTGTFVYQQGARSETSRITRYGAGDIERLEVMDGMPREIVRTRDTVRCYLPSSKVVKVERRAADRNFPALVPEQVGALAKHYDISLGETRRIAGFDCQAVLLTPKDNLRYGYKLYADAGTGMLLRAVTVDANGETIEQFSFTHLAIGNVTREMVRPRHDAGTWRTDHAEASPAQLAGWGLTAELPGFRKIVELKRRLGASRPVGQVVYSDGLAAVSVFIEPLDAARKEALRTGLASVGAIHIYTREVANHMVTVVGEAPAVSVQRIANAVEYRETRK
jgi:sigma-E factor negative regulatory protein RseB